jgi:hypothetical protein
VAVTLLELRDDDGFIKAADMYDQTLELIDRSPCEDDDRVVSSPLMWQQTRAVVQ